MQYIPNAYQDATSSCSDYLSLVHYPAAEKAYVVVQRGSAMCLEVVDRATGHSTQVDEQKGYMDRMELDDEEDMEVRESLLGDEKGLVWFVGQKLRYYRFRP